MSSSSPAPPNRATTGAAAGAAAPTTTLCKPCTGNPELISAVHAQILKLDLKIRGNVSILMIYGLIIVAIIALLAYILYILYRKYCLWRAMSAEADPPLQDPADTLSMSGILDDEIYASDKKQARANMVDAGVRIDAAMDQLETVYGPYNEQIKKYSRDVLREAPDDIIDRSVLDVSKDDFNYAPKKLRN
jgi:hypothetical protein